MYTSASLNVCVKKTPFYYLANKAERAEVPRVRPCSFEQFNRFNLLLTGLMFIQKNCRRINILEG